MSDETPSPQHDACGARLTLRYPTAVDSTDVCALGPHDFNTWHRSADGTQWRATDFPPTAPAAFGDAVARSVVAGLGAQIDAMIELFGKLRSELDGGKLDAVDDALREAGIDYSTGARGVTDLANQRDGAREHADNAEDALSRIADMARQALGPDGHGQLSVALGRILAVTEEKNR